MKLTVKQMHGLLKHPDSPYIRAVSFCSLFFILFYSIFMNVMLHDAVSAH
uniref:ATSRL1 n=1 Tax=Arundo donax TaxID=35708 RepID=A0A0A8ZYU2_ARUDO